MINRKIFSALGPWALAAMLLPTPKIVADVQETLTPTGYDGGGGSSNMPQQTDQKPVTPKRVTPNQDDINDARRGEAASLHYVKEDLDKSVALNVEPDKYDRAEVLAEQALPHKDGGEIDWEAVDKKPSKYASNAYVQAVKSEAGFNAGVRVKAESLIPNMTQAEKDLLRPTASEWALAKKESTRYAVALKDDFESNGFERHADMLALPHNGKAINWDQISKNWDKWKTNSFVQDVQSGAEMYGRERYRLTHPNVKVEDIKFEKDPRPPLSASMLDQAAKDDADRQRTGNETTKPATDKSQVPGGTGKKLPDHAQPPLGTPAPANPQPPTLEDIKDRHNHVPAMNPMQVNPQ